MNRFKSQPSYARLILCGMFIDQRIKDTLGIAFLSLRNCKISFSHWVNCQEKLFEANLQRSLLNGLIVAPHPNGVELVSKNVQRLECEDPTNNHSLTPKNLNF